MGSTQNTSDIADSYGVFTYKSDLIWFQCENHDSYNHRDAVLKYDEYAKAYIKRLDEEIFTEKPLFTPDIFTQENVQQEWEHEKWSSFFTKIFDQARVHSYCIIRLYKEYPYWKVYTERHVTEIVYDKKDRPLSCTVEWSRSLPHSTKYTNYKEEITFFNKDDFLTLEPEANKNYGLLIPFGQPDNENDIGEYDLSDKWDKLIDIRYINLYINSNARLMFFWLKYGNAISPEGRQNLVNAFDMAAITHAIGAKGSTLEDVKAYSPDKPEFSIDALESKIKQFAMACRLPLVYFRSESETSNPFGGDMVSGEEMKINKKKHLIFSKFRSAIIDLIFMRWGIVVEDVQADLLESEEEEIEVPLDEKKPNNEKEINGTKMEVITE